MLKGIGWLLREAAKADGKAILPFLMEFRDSAPRLVLRTACETLPPAARAKVLAKPKAALRTSGNSSLKIKTAHRHRFAPVVHLLVSELYYVELMDWCL